MNAIVEHVPGMMIGGTVLLLVLLVARPELIRARGGVALATVGLIVLPTLATAVGFSAHVENSKTTRFCLSCHVMEPYGKSLLVDAADHLPAVHVQNHLVPQEQACFTCHTTYTMFGDYRAKLRGLRHVYVYYLGHVPEKIHLYEPYSNRECLHCHEGMRKFEEADVHVGVRDDIAQGKTSCLDCHSTAHDVAHVDGAKMWKRWEDVRSSLTVWDRWKKVTP